MFCERLATWTAGDPSADDRTLPPTTAVVVELIQPRHPSWSSPTTHTLRSSLVSRILRSRPPMSPSHWEFDSSSSSLLAAAVAVVVVFEVVVVATTVVAVLVGQVDATGATGLVRPPLNPRLDRTAVPWFLELPCSSERSLPLGCLLSPSSATLFGAIPLLLPSSSSVTHRSGLLSFFGPLSCPVL